MPPKFTRLNDYLDFNAAHNGDRDALVDGDRRFTWRQTLDAAEALASAFADAGLAAGDRIAVWSVPSVESTLLYYACVRAGFVFVGLNPRFTSDEASFILNDADVRLVYFTPAFEERSYGEDLTAMDVGAPCIPIDPASGSVFHDQLKSQVDEARIRSLVDAVAPETPVALVYTSGTTGTPKGAFLTQWGMAHNYWWILSERWCSPFKMLAHSPINHLAMLGDTVALATVAGGTQFPMARFDPRRALELIQSEAITYYKGSPTHHLLFFRELGEHPEGDLSSIQYWYWGGAAVPAALLDLMERWSPRVGSCYGSTELNGSVTFIRPGDTREQKLNTIGRPVGPYRVRLASADGIEVAEGDVGELQSQGDFHTTGYFNREATAADLFTPDGWMRTGDLCRRRPDGFYELVGRAKEMFKSGGYNVYPREIELRLESHPEIAMAAVVSVPDPLWSEVGFAFVVERSAGCLNVEAVGEWARAGLANYKVPKRVAILREMPMLAVGKIDRRALREHARTVIEEGSPST